MKDSPLMDTRTGETGSLDYFFRKFTMFELGRFIKGASRQEIEDTKKRLVDRNKPDGTK